VITNLWLALPFDILVLLAGLANLPQEPFEAAEVDGASSPQIFLRSTLPLLRPVIAIILVIRIADAFRVFDVVYVLTGGARQQDGRALDPHLPPDVFELRLYRWGGGVRAACRHHLARVARHCPRNWRAHREA